MRAHREPIAHLRERDRTPQFLHEHLHGVERLSGALAAKIGLEPAGALIGLLHDLGKYSEEFQNYLASAVGDIDPDQDDYVDALALKGKIDHSSAGAQYIWQQLSRRGPVEHVVAQFLALCVASHHSGLIDCISAGERAFGEDIFTRRMKKADEKTHLDEVMQRIDASVEARARALLADSRLVENLKTIIRAISDANKAAPKVIAMQLGLLVRALFSCLVDADRIDTSDFERGESGRSFGSYMKWEVLTARLERHLEALAGQRPIDRARAEVSRHCLEAAERPPGIYTLTVPTGGGKTLASLRFALRHAGRYGLERVFYVIPFTSIIDQNAQIVREVLERDEDRGQVVLEHHSNVTPEQQTWREKMLCENWDAPVVYTTMVQFLEALFGRGTRGARRMHQLARAVIVFDEIQTVPMSCVHMFNNAINFLVERCGSSVVLCTATQPLLQKVSAERGSARLEGRHEIIADVQGLFEKLRRVEVRDARKAAPWAFDEVGTLAAAELQRAKSCLIIVNTKASAKAVYEHCARRVAGEVVYHLSTDMCPAHRKHVLAEVRQRLDEKAPVLCVSTQLIEAGVDVDFGAVIRSVAGLDSIAQAAGRCNRNGASALGVVHVINPEGENLTRLRDIDIGREKASRIIDDYRKSPERYGHDLIGPRALAEYYEYYFYARAAEMSYSVGKKSLGHDDTLLDLLSTNDQAVTEYARKAKTKPGLFLRQSFMSAAEIFKAIEAPTQGVVVPYGRGKKIIERLCAAYQPEREFALLREAQQFTVNLFQQVFDALLKAGALHPVQPEVRVYHLDPRYYSAAFGVATEPVSREELLYV